MFSRVLDLCLVYKKSIAFNNNDRALKNAELCIKYEEKYL